MKSKLLNWITFFIFAFGILPVINGCSDRNDTVRCFPDTNINVVLNLNLVTYFDLQNVNGWIYVNEQQDGTRGLIVVRTTNGFKVYDRNAPHLCPGDDTTLVVKSGTKVVCPADGAEWILLTGEPTAIANVPPKTYSYYYNSATNVLNIYN